MRDREEIRDRKRGEEEEKVRVLSMLFIQLVSFSSNLYESQSNVSLN